MENAVKALEIAAGVFFALLILGSLVLGYNQIANLRRTEYLVEQDTQAADFNKSYEVYNTNSIYGSEIFSLANKVVDYNNKYKEEDGYEKLELNVKFSKDYGNIFRKNTSYTGDDLNNKYNYLSNTIKNTREEKLTNNEGVQKTIQEWAKLSRITLTQNFGAGSSEYNKIENYKDLITTQNDIVRTTFKCTGFTYYENGRIKSMNFVEN